MGKTRSDSWAARMTLEQQIALYQKAKRTGAWRQAAEWAATEFGAEKTPSKSAFYRWMETMAREERERRMEEMATAAAEASSLGKEAPRDSVIVDAFKALALKAALDGDAKTAASLMKSATAVEINAIRTKALALLRRRVEVLESKEKREVRASRISPNTPLSFDAKFRERYGLPERKAGERLYTPKDFVKCNTGDFSTLQPEHFRIVMGEK